MNEKVTKKRGSYNIGNKNNWKGGIKLSSLGYCFTLVPQNPHSDSNGYYLTHRLVMEGYLGRYLEPYEIVHHIDGNKNNNDINNLELLDGRGTHIKGHWKNGNYEKRSDKRRVQFTDRQLIEIEKQLEEKTYKEVAANFNVATMTVWRLKNIFNFRRLV